jgi:hypothetical protein
MEIALVPRPFLYDDTVLLQVPLYSRGGRGCQDIHQILEWCRRVSFCSPVGSNNDDP